ncbi:MAG: type III-A CRISPR-associated protein Csm2 [Dehalococcoidia bacterium]
MDYRTRQDRGARQRATSDINFYTSQGDLRPELLDSEARSYAEKFASGKRDESVSSTQLRRFYNDVKQLQDRIEKDIGKDKMDSTEAQDLAKHLATVKMLKAKVAYARRSGTRERVSQKFVELISGCVDAIRSPKDLWAFAQFFEAIVGYYYYFEAQKKSQAGGE